MLLGCYQLICRSLYIIRGHGVQFVKEDVAFEPNPLLSPCASILALRQGLFQGGGGSGGYSKLDATY